MIDVKLKLKFIESDNIDLYSHYRLLIDIKRNTIFRRRFKQLNKLIKFLIKEEPSTRIKTNVITDCKLRKTFKLKEGGKVYCDLILRTDSYLLDGNLIVVIRESISNKLLEISDFEEFEIYLETRKLVLKLIRNILCKERIKLNKKD